jgi:predicted PurR-regulated permease PerM
MTKGMVRGQFIIAVIQGTTSAFILWFTGVPYFAFFALILSFMSLIPLGAGILTIPIGIVRILLGDVWQGLLIVLGHVLLVTNIDNILKPILVPKSVKLQPALMLLAVFAGLGLFGFLGIFIGPVIMILIITTIDVYLRATEKSQKQVTATKE